MITAIKTWVTSYEFASLLALYTYWIPLVVCTVVYLVRFVAYYRADLKASAGQYYTPKLTVGHIVWHIIVATLPAINIFAMVFDCSGAVFRWLGKAMNIPLVRGKHDKQ